MYFTMVQTEQTYTDLEESELFEPYTVSRINDKSLSSRNQEEQIKLTTKPNEKITNHVSATKTRYISGTHQTEA